VTVKEVLGKCKPKERSGKQKEGVAVSGTDEVDIKVKGKLCDKISIYRNITKLQKETLIK